MEPTLSQHGRLSQHRLAPPHFQTEPPEPHVLEAPGWTGSDLPSSKSLRVSSKEHRHGPKLRIHHIPQSTHPSSKCEQTVGWGPAGWAASTGKFVLKQ